MNEFPRTMVGGVSLPRIIIGSNWFMGYSHTSKSKDDYVKAMQTPERIADILEVFLAVGIDAIIGNMEMEKLARAAKIAEDRTGKTITRISTPSFPDFLTPEGESAAMARLDAEAERGVTFCMPHQDTTDALLDRTTRTIRGVDRIVAAVRERGMIPGLSTHMPEPVIYADESGLDVETYIQIYNAAGFLMQIEVDWVHRMIQQAAKPVMTIKPLAAGRLIPLVGLAFAWATLREQDMVCVGTMTPDEAREVIEISMSLLEGRAANVELQRTRSKASVEGACPR